MTKAQEAWLRLAAYYRGLATGMTSPDLKLACLVLEAECGGMWSGDRDGISDEMIALAEGLVGERLKDRHAEELARDP